MTHKLTYLSRLRARPFAQALFLVTAVAAAVGLASCGEQAQPTPTALATVNADRPRGEVVFARYCNSCHPGGGRGAGPSLIQGGSSEDEFKRVVRQGEKRMPGFNEGLISDDDLDQMYDYIVSLTK
jgi:mono/diheme cytochrome c family protein